MFWLWNNLLTCAGILQHKPSDTFRNNILYTLKNLSNYCHLMSRCIILLDIYVICCGICSYMLLYL